MNQQTPLPDGAVSIPGHFVHALRETVAIQGDLPHGRLFRVDFQDCTGASPAPTEVTCSVGEATDKMSNPLAGVTCSASPL